VAAARRARQSLVQGEGDHSFPGEGLGEPDAVAAGLDNPQTCRVLMEAATLAACEPAIAATVRAAGAVTRDQLAGLFPGRRC
jgi:hypothetical protein